MRSQDRTLKVYDGKVFGVEVSSYGLKGGYLDYKALAGIIGDCILNNTLIRVTESHDWELASGCEYFWIDEDGRECDQDSEDYHDMVLYEIYQYYIISENGANLLDQYTDEIVYYNSELDIYLWAVTHFGTSWDYVLTDLKIERA